MAQDEGEALYLALQRALQPNESGSFLTLLRDAVPIDSWGDGDLPGTDLLPEPNWVAEADGASTLETYRRILTAAEWGRLPFTPAEQGRFDTLVARLYTRDQQTGAYAPSSAFAGYLAARELYNQRLADWQATPPGERTPEQQQALESARQAHTNYPNAQNLRTDLRNLRTLYNYDYNRFGRRAAVRFNPDPSSPRPASPTTTIPDQHSLPNATYSAATVAVGGDFRPPYGYMPELHQWRLNGSEASLRTPDAILSFEFTPVRATRPWLDEDAFFGTGTATWRLSSGGVASTGKVADRPGSRRDLTFVPSASIVVRRLCVRSNWTSEQRRFLRRSIRSGSNLSYGPFLLAGTTEGGGRITPVMYESGKLCAPAYYLVGLVSRLSPAAPNPRADLVWGQSLPALPGLD